MRYISILIGLLLWTSMASAQTYYVDATGSDSNTCAQAQVASTPKQTILAGLACVGSDGSNKTVMVKAGTYTDVLTNLPSGSAQAMFVLKCETDLACNLQAGAGNFSILMSVPTHYVTVRGFHFGHSKGSALSASDFGVFHDIQFLNNEWDGTISGSDAISISGGDDILIQGNLIHDIPGNAGYSHGIYLSSHTWRITIEHNQIYGCGAYGVHINGNFAYSPSTTTDHVVRFNLLHNNGTPNVNGSGIVAYDSTNIVIYGNLSYANAF